jgi:hypothetical protein
VFVHLVTGSKAGEVELPGFHSLWLSPACRRGEGTCCSTLPQRKLCWVPWLMLPKGKHYLSPASSNWCKMPDPQEPWTPPFKPIALSNSYIHLYCQQSEGGNSTSWQEEHCTRKKVKLRLKQSKVTW